MGLTIYQAKLSDFTSIERYLRFKHNFIMQSVRFDYSEISKSNLVIDEIIVSNRSFGEEDSYDKYKYIRDYFIPSVEKLAKDWEVKFLEKTKKLYTAEDKKGFSRETQNTFTTALEIIKTAKYLNRVQRIFLVERIIEFENIVLDYLDDPLPHIKRKIEFNWNKNTLVYFFHLLRENGVIGQIRDSDLGRVIDDRFLYKTANGYQVPKDCRKLLFGYSDKGEKLSSEPSDIIKKTFSDQDFYNV